MVPLIIGGGLTILSLGIWLWPKKKVIKEVLPDFSNHISQTAPPVITDAEMVPVELNGERWLVARNYIGPVGIGEAAQIAKDAGMELPSPALVDAIWRQADMKIVPPTRAKNEPTEAVYHDQRERIRKLIGETPFTLIGGTFKDIVIVNGLPQLYGWHVEDGKNVGIPLHKPVTSGPGKVIQPPSGKAHGQFFKDYSQGLRLVKRA